MPARVRNRHISAPMPPLLLTTPTGPGRNMRSGTSPPVPPSFALPGLTMPWLLGADDERAPLRRAREQCAGVMMRHALSQNVHGGHPRLDGFQGSFSHETRGHEEHGEIHLMRADGVGHGAVYRHTAYRLAPFSRRHARHHAGAVVRHGGQQIASPRPLWRPARAPGFLSPAECSTFIAPVAARHDPLGQVFYRRLILVPFHARNLGDEFSGFLHPRTRVADDDGELFGNQAPLPLARAPPRPLLYPPS